MEEFDFYPPKPELIESKPKGGLAVTIFSMVLFVMAFLFIFSDSLNFVVYLLLVLLIHEMGHFLLMKIFKYENVRMLFVPLMGAFVQGSKNKYSEKQSFLVVAAGPFPGIIFGIILAFFAQDIHNENIMSLAGLFIFLNVLNLIPLDPLDGGQFFKLLFRKKHELILMIFSFISSLIIIGFGWYIDSYILMIFGFFMGFRVRAMQKQFQVHNELRSDDVNYTTTYKLLSNRDFSKIKEVVLNNTPALRKYIDQVAPEESNPILASQVNNVLVTPMKHDASLLFKFVLVLLWLAAFVAPIWMFLTFDLKWYIDASF